MIEWLLVIPSFCGVFLKAFQQKNVMHNKYFAVPFATYGMAICEVFLISKVASTGITWAAVNGIALGGATGCLLAMVIHDRMFSKADMDTQGITKLLRIFRRMGR